MEDRICPVCQIECREGDSAVLISFEMSSPEHGHVFKKFWHKQCYLKHHFVLNDYVHIMPTQPEAGL